MSTVTTVTTGQERASINSIQRPHSLITEVIYTISAAQCSHCPSASRRSCQLASHPRPSLLITIPCCKTHATLLRSNPKDIEGQHQASFTPMAYRSLTLSAQLSALIARPETLHCQLPGQYTTSTDQRQSSTPWHFRWGGGGDSLSDTHPDSGTWRVRCK